MSESDTNDTTTDEPNLTTEGPFRATSIGISGFERDYYVVKDSHDVDNRTFKRGVTYLGVVNGTTNYGVFVTMANYGEPDHEVVTLVHHTKLPTLYRPDDYQQGDYVGIVPVAFERDGEERFESAVVAHVDCENLDPAEFDSPIPLDDTLPENLRLSGDTVNAKTPSDGSNPTPEAGGSGLNKVDERTPGASPETEPETDSDSVPYIRNVDPDAWGTYTKAVEVEAVKLPMGVRVRTPDGTVALDAGDYIVRGDDGERRPVKADEFEDEYTEVSQ